MDQPTDILDAAHRLAEETMLDRAIVLAQAETYKAFIAHLNASPAPSEKLRRTMQTPPPWK